MMSQVWRIAGRPSSWPGLRCATRACGSAWCTNIHTPCCTLLHTNQVWAHVRAWTYPTAASTQASCTTRWASTPLAHPLVTLPAFACCAPPRTWAPPRCALPACSCCRPGPHVRRGAPIPLGRTPHESQQPPWLKLTNPLPNHTLLWWVWSRRTHTTWNPVTPLSTKHSWPPLRAFSPLPSRADQWRPGTRLPSAHTVLLSRPRAVDAALHVERSFTCTFFIHRASA